MNLISSWLAMGIDLTKQRWSAPTQLVHVPEVTRAREPRRTLLSAAKTLAGRRPVESFAERCGQCDGTWSGSTVAQLTPNSSVAITAPGRGQGGLLVARPF